MKNNNILYLSLSLLFIVTACSKDRELDEDLGEVITERFTEGTVEMGIYSHGIDIGYYIDHIDFSRNDTRQQLEDLIEELGPEKSLISHFQAIGERNPMAGLALILNTLVCDYHIKGETVLGKARGFGYLYDHFHDQHNDIGKIYMETMVETPEIPEADRNLYVEYVPSEQQHANPNSTFDVEFFDRQHLGRKENVMGYACDVTVYTPKAGITPPADPNNPISGAMMHKLVVYTSPLFSNTINFTHPFYVPEAGGILRLDIFLEDSEVPTLEMRPSKITPQSITDSQLAIQQSEPVYGMHDISLAMKALAIFMSGWSTFDE